MCHVKLIGLSFYHSYYKTIMLTGSGMLKFAGDTTEEGETTDGWEEEDEVEPKVPCL